MKTKQVSQNSGRIYHFNLDSLTCQKMKEISQYHASNETPASLSVLIRRSIRVYRDHLKRLRDGNSKIHEGYQLLRAGKGL
jgi:hypothetical protein